MHDSAIFSATSSFACSIVKFKRTHQWTTYIFRQHIFQARFREDLFATRLCPPRLKLVCSSNIHMTVAHLSISVQLNLFHWTLARADENCTRSGLFNYQRTHSRQKIDVLMSPTAGGGSLFSRTVRDAVDHHTHAHSFFGT